MMGVANTKSDSIDTPTLLASFTANQGYITSSLDATDLQKLRVTLVPRAGPSSSAGCGRGTRFMAIVNFVSSWNELDTLHRRS